MMSRWLLKMGRSGWTSASATGTDLLEEDAATGSWVRKASDLTMLTVMRKRPGAGQTEDFDSFHMDTSQPVEINLADPPGAAVINEGTLTLTFSGSGSTAEIRIQLKMFSLTRMGRRTTHGGDLRIMNIRLVAREGNPPVSVPKEIVLRPVLASPVDFGTVIAMLHAATP